MGIRYLPVFRPEDLEDLPVPARAAVDSFISAHAGAERGLVRGKNDKTMDNRAARFRDWAYSVARLTDKHFVRLTPVASQFLLAAYLQSVKNQGQPNGRPYRPNTLVNFLNAAHKFLQLVTGTLFPIREISGKTTKLLSIYGDTISLCQKWSEPKSKRAGYTWRIFLALREMKKEATQDDITCYLDLYPTAFDWLRLGCFTGSRAGEYAQTVAKKGEFSKVPDDAASGQWAGYAIAFIKGDFTLLTEGMVVLPNTLATLDEPDQIFETHVRFRFDKGKENFAIRKFRRTRSFMCPVKAILSILRRALILNVSDMEPVGVYRTGTRGRYTYLRSSEIIKIVREACR